MAQAVKLANNFLSATALAATSEAVAMATSAGVTMATLLEVINASSGQSAASTDKFVNHVLTERYSSGFLNTLMAKDVDLYLQAARSRRISHTYRRPDRRNLDGVRQRGARHRLHADPRPYFERSRRGAART